MPGGPLLAKKPAKPAWDFRDMLPPREPDDFPERSEPATGGEPPMIPAIARPEISLIEPSLQERLQALIAPPLPQGAESPEPATSIGPIAPILEEPIEPDWQTGPLWLTDEDASPPPAMSLFETIVGAPRRLWARLCDWLGI